MKIEVNTDKCAICGKDIESNLTIATEKNGDYELVSVCGVECYTEFMKRNAGRCK